MAMEIKISQSPYEFDTDENGFPTFTRKNINFLNAILRYDSNYSIASDRDNLEYQMSYAGILEKENFFDFAASEDAVKIDELGNLVDDLYRAIVSIDAVNSTHLASEGHKEKDNRGETQKNNKGRAKVAARIREIGGQNLKERLARGDAALVSEIASSEVGGKHNFSFATKFCTYVSRHALQRDCYCIYDEILRSVLPYYGYMYIDDFCENYAHLYKVIRATRKNGYQSRKESLVGQFKDNDDYEGYRTFIDAIIQGVREKVGETITYADFDHMVWYFFKSSKSKVLAAMNKIPD